MNCLKLSPNLRGKLAESDKDPDKSSQEIWMERMEHLLDLVTEIPVGPSA